MLTVFMEILRKMKPQFSFVYAILAKWYVIILVPTIIATYYVFFGLEKVGLFAAAENLVSTQMQTIVNIAKYCTPKILQISDFAKCIMYTH